MREWECDSRQSSPFQGREPPPPEEGGEEDGLKRIIEVADCRLGSAPILGEEESGSDAQCSAEC